MNELVSVITPSYNSAKFISQTIESVLAQTYENWEMIIVDDASPDNSNDIIENYCEKDSRIKLIKLERNSGPAVARNRAIEKAKGRYMAFLDADDLWKPEKLEKQLVFMYDNGCSFSYSFYETMNEEGKRLYKIIRPPVKLSYNDMLKSNYIGCLTVIYDTEKLGKMYMPLIKKRQDYGLWLNILKKIDYAFCAPEVLAIYRVRESSISINKFTLLKYNWKLFRKCEEFSVSKSLYYLTWNIIIKLMNK
ncbi:MAG: glycosyltransferase family 2 protein [Flexistipes sinusarabici]|uniref:Glycosyltransferase family 2 protein n=1 Tax=Flexistipes sinusarabici TaxID=2352 RepID=A0A5D0MPJ6_FLESI|nr:glycosyltransferase family 2 protein [Flexistipes sinusarabici]TYB33573.1 MAG: glycosyltransferase family 2 protein [Flexistipes sinusarabici]